MLGINIVFAENSLIMSSKNWLLTIGAAVLLHVVLISLTILEVFIYSMWIEPGHDEAFYSAHAETSGPWVATIFGAIIIFFLVKRYIRKNPEGHLIYALALPGAYVVIDFILLPFTGPEWASYIGIFAILGSVRLLAGYVSYRIYKPS